MTTSYFGVDPGVSGGLAMIHMNDMYTSVHAVRMPDTEREIFTVLSDWAQYNTDVAQHSTVASIEFVRSSPQMGVASAFKFGWSYGGLRMALAAAGISFTEVTPAKWQGALGCRSGGDKNVTKKRAQELFPHIKVTHAIADALLLAEYTRRVSTGILVPRSPRTISEEN